MADVIEERAGTKILLCDQAGPAVESEQDALDLIGATYGGATLVALPVSRLTADFFDLSTTLAGQMLQKFVNYQVRLAIIGDISQYVERSEALAAFVIESNRGPHVWFLPDMEALDARLQLK